MPILSNSGVKNAHFSVKNPYFPFKNGDFKGGGLNKTFDVKKAPEVPYVIERPALTASFSGGIGDLGQ